jgi:NDP-sugar pyrophosphorylase family protein
MVLGAGRGTRLGELGRKVPKVLVDVGGRPLLARQAEYLAAQGVDRVVVNAHHLSEALVEFAAAYRGPAKLEVVVEPSLLGTAGGVRNALERLGGGPFLVLYGDVLIRESLRPMIEMHERVHPSATVTVYESWHTEGKGTVELDDDDRVRQFREKSGDVPVPAWINAGIYLLEPSLVERLPAAVPLDFGHDVFPEALERGGHIQAHRLSEPVLDIGTPEALVTAQTDESRSGRWSI